MKKQKNYNELIKINIRILHHFDGIFNWQSGLRWCVNKCINIFAIKIKKITHNYIFF